ncbi:Hsp20/alpha crystallin family protein [Desulfallas sp. Bu1-1]|uniref:Hsp20/alpha crystallin family protein n=1 Tax=Desulfallas sp. Bu1-1 TaxID=2787620 RepID=UPI0028BE7446|nr:Hsp20/alpha crystallin family protein [Desulfallas sp. Bu1-1]
MIVLALVPYDPFRAMDLMRRDLDRFFTPLWGNFREDFNTGPRIDVYETDNEVVAQCEIPGIEKKEDISIDINDNILSISGVINRASEIKEENRYHRSERFFGRFQRSVTLPARVREEGARASYRNGVLEIRMPKETRGQHRTIDVEWH